MTEEKSNKKTEEINLPSNKELYWTLGIIVSLIVIFLLASAFFKSLGSFEYEDMTFKKDKFGEIPIFLYTYNTIQAGKTNVINVVLRFDPRKNKVPIYGEIDLNHGGQIFLSIGSEGLEQCEYSIISVSTLSSFLASNGFKVQGATLNKEEAENLNITYATCEEFSQNTVIQILSGEKTQIVREPENCYTITVANCEILPAFEKFTVQSIIDAKKRSTNSSA